MPMLDAILALLLSNTTAILTLSTLSQHCPPTLLPSHSTSLTPLLSSNCYCLLLCSPTLLPSHCTRYCSHNTALHCCCSHALLFSHDCSHTTTLTPLILRCYYCAAALTLLLSHCCFLITTSTPVAVALTAALELLLSSRCSLTLPPSHRYALAGLLSIAAL